MKSDEGDDGTNGNDGDGTDGDDGNNDYDMMVLIRVQVVFIACSMPSSPGGRC